MISILYSITGLYHIFISRDPKCVAGFAEPCCIVHYGHGILVETAWECILVL